MLAHLNITVGIIRVMRTVGGHWQEEGCSLGRAVNKRLEQRDYGLKQSFSNLSS